MFDDQFDDHDLDGLNASRGILTAFAIVAMAIIVGSLIWWWLA